MHMRNAQTVETVVTVGSDGSVRIGGLPFRPGESVRVLLLPEHTSIRRGHTQDEIEQSRKRRERLKGTILRYDGPTDPVGVQDWEVLQDGDAQ